MLNLFQGYCTLNKFALITLCKMLTIQRYLPKQFFDTMAKVVLKNRVGYYLWLEETCCLMNARNLKKNGIKQLCKNGVHPYREGMLDNPADKKVGGGRCNHDCRYVHCYVPYPSIYYIYTM